MAKRKSNGLGRLVPTDFKHVEKYPLRAIAPRVVTVAEKVLDVNTEWVKFYNQGNVGACVGFSISLMMSILNRRRYDAMWLYREAQKIDEWEGENYSGTSVRAGLDVLRETGHVRIYRGGLFQPDRAEGIIENRWAINVDEIRTSVATGSPVVLGINWYDKFFTPNKLRNGEYWIPADPTTWGGSAGGHAICCYGVSDRREAVKLVNSWGLSYPRVWLPYTALEVLLHEQGEAAIVTDFIGI